MIVSRSPLAASRVSSSARLLAMARSSPSSFAAAGDVCGSAVSSGARLASCGGTARLTVGAAQLSVLDNGSWPWRASCAAMSSTGSSAVVSASTGLPENDLLRALIARPDQQGRLRDQTQALGRRVLQGRMQSPPGLRPVGQLVRKTARDDLQCGAWMDRGANPIPLHLQVTAIGHWRRGPWRATETLPLGLIGPWP